MGKVDYNLCDCFFDSQFDKVELLKRYPWIGRDFSKTDCRILILGDSHYATDSNGEFSPDEYVIFCHDKESTRDVVNCVIKNVCRGESTWKMFKNLLETFNSFTSDGVMSFWPKVAFYNFIQEPMKEKNQVPTTRERIEGWKCFCDVVDIIKPSFCLFIGMRSKYKIDTIKKIGGLYSILSEQDSCNGVNPIFGCVKTPKGTETKIRIIRHTSRYYSPNVWYQYLYDKEKKIVLQLDAHLG